MKRLLLIAVCVCLMPCVVCGCKNPRPEAKDEVEVIASDEPVQAGERDEGFPWPVPVGAEEISPGDLKALLAKIKPPDKTVKTLIEIVSEETDATIGSRDKDFIYNKYYLFHGDAERLGEYYMNFGLHPDKWKVWGVEMPTGWDLPGMRLIIFLKKDLRRENGLKEDEHASVAIHVLGGHIIISHAVNIDTVEREEITSAVSAIGERSGSAA